MSRAGTRRALLALGLALAPLSARPPLAQAQNVNIERFEPALDAEGFLGVQGTRTPGHLRTSFGLFVHYANSLLEVEAPAAMGSGAEADVVSERAATSLSAELGLSSRAAVALTLPLVLYQSGDALGPLAPDVEGFAVSDPGLHLRYRLLGDVGRLRRDGPGLGLQVGATAPLGADDTYAGEGAVRAYAKLLFDLHLLGAGLGASLGVRHRFEERALFGRELRDEMTFGAALKLPIPPLYPLAGLLEVRGATDFASAETTAVEGEIGAQLGLGEVTLALGVGAGFTGGYGTPGVRAIAGLWYTPRDPDTDGDGIPDDEDACPPLPEDFDGFEDDDGCPDPDNDNDLVPDIDDLCPNEEALEGMDEDEDGCTDPR